MSTDLKNMVKGTTTKKTDGFRYVSGNGKPSELLSQFMTKKGISAQIDDTGFEYQIDVSFHPLLTQNIDGQLRVQKFQRN